MRGDIPVGQVLPSDDFGTMTPAARLDSYRRNISHLRDKMIGVKEKLQVIEAMLLDKENRTERKSLNAMLESAQQALAIIRKNDNSPVRTLQIGKSEIVDE